MAEPVRVSARIEAVTPLGAGVRAIRLQAPAAPRFLPGQYLQIIDGVDSFIPFSIASSPDELPQITLHYLAQTGADDAARMDVILETQSSVDLLLPCGDCGFSDPLVRPLLALAGGSGIAGIRSLLRTLLPAQVDLRLYWGAATAEDLYLRWELDELASRHERFTWTPVSEAAAPGCRTGRIGEVVAEDVASGALELSDWEVLIAGGPPMVWGTVEVLKPWGLTRSQARSDVFAYAPRADLWD
ncbi:MAG: hypothetical protein JJT88_20555 [Gammaproteobacteria bacterium]|nr:hypothetical protein [Gammaproteobacteria bacterium]